MSADCRLHSIREKKTITSQFMITSISDQIAVPFQFHWNTLSVTCNMFQYLFIFSFSFWLLIVSTWLTVLRDIFAIKVNTVRIANFWRLTFILQKKDWFFSSRKSIQFQRNVFNSTLKRGQSDPVYVLF